MTERPILFSAPMVRAILAGTKTQTRRALKIQPLDILPMEGEFAGRQWVALMSRKPEPKGMVLRCKHGVPGDRLWVREAWTTHAFLDAVAPRDLKTISIHYLADGGDIKTGKYRPGMFMPRRISRINLEITDVRVERLQDISEADAIAEGISEFIGGWWCEHDDAEQIAGTTPQEGYRHLWERINGKGSWDANPWVWAISFRMIKP